MNKKYTVQEEEISSTPRRRIIIWFESDDFSMAWNFLWHHSSLAYTEVEDSKKFQLVERNEGMGFVRVEVIFDNHVY